MSNIYAKQVENGKSKYTITEEEEQAINKAIESKAIYKVKDIKKNKMFIILFIVIALITILMTFIGGDVLRMAPLDGAEWVLVVGLSIGMIIVDLIRKAIIKIFRKK